jgi:para-aminobenzoate synthetase component 1
MPLSEIEYSPDSAERFASFVDRPWFAFLDSGRGGAHAGRYDIVAADPYATLTTRGELTTIRSRDGTRHSRADPLRLLADCLGPRSETSSPLPFTGGAIGYFSYDLARRFERLPQLAAADIPLPEMAVGLYDWVFVVDHDEQRSWLAGAGRDRRTLALWRELADAAVTRAPRNAAAPFRILSPVASNFDRAAYRRAFERVATHIRDGDCYQVNLAQRFASRVSGDPWGAYLGLRATNPAPFSAYLAYPFGTILSSSPERFLSVRGDRVETKPIKGTRPRSRDPQRDRALAAALAASAKDRAENVMIVDLLRNDLGKSCVAGSVGVDALFEVESFASVHHLVSTVSGRLAPALGALDLLRGCFPGGSITGAPKLRAMQIIEALEPQRRSVYCGAIGYVGFDGNMDTNIAIRTMVRTGDSIYAWAGGGIVADSQEGSEYQESLDKAAALLAILTNRSYEEAATMCDQPR